MTSKKEIEDLGDSSDKTNKKTNKFFKDFSAGSESASRHLLKLEEQLTGVGNKLKGSSSYVKNIDKITAGVVRLDKQINELAEGMESVGISSSSTLREITNEAHESVEALKKMVKESGQVSSALSKLDSTPKKIALIRKGFKEGFDTKELSQLFKILDGVKSKIPQKEFEKLHGVLSKVGTGTAGLETFKNELTQLSGILSKDLINEFREVDEAGIFQGMEENARGAVERLKATQSELASLDEMGQVMEDLVKHSSTLQNQTKKFTSDNEKAIEGLTKKVENLAVKTQEAGRSIEKSLMTQEHLKEFQARTEDAIKHIKAASSDNYLFPSDILPYIDKIKKYQKEVIDNTQKLKEAEQSLVDLGVEDLKGKEKALETIKEINLELRKSARNVEAATNEAKSYVTSAENLNKNKMGVEQTNKLAMAMYAAHLRLKAMNTEAVSKTPIIGKIIGGLSKGFETLGQNASKFSFSVGLISSAVSLAKAVMSVDEKASKMYQSLNESNLTLKVSAEETKTAMHDMMSEVINTKGLYDASKQVKGSYALGLDEILATVSALDKAGFAASDLKEEMKGVMKNVTGTNALVVGSATIVRSFAHNLGITDGEVANLFGGMRDSFGSTFGVINDNLVSITSSFQNAAMTNTRFLGILGTSTAGMSLYSEQVAATAREISRLSKAAGLTTSDIEALAKGANSLGDDTNQLAVNMGTFLDKEGRAEVGKTISGSIVGLKDNLKKTPVKDEKKRNDLENQINTLTKMKGFLDEGKDLPFAAMFKALDGESKFKLQSEIFKKVFAQFGKDAYMLKAVLEKIGMGYMNDPSIRNPNLSKELDTKDKSKPISQQQQMAKGSEVENLAGNALAKLITAGEQEVIDLAKKNLDVLEEIALALGVVGGVKLLVDLLGLAKTIGAIGAVTEGFTLLGTAAIALKVAIAGVVGYLVYKLGSFFMETDWAKEHLISDYKINTSTNDETFKKGTKKSNILNIADSPASIAKQAWESKQWEKELKTKKFMKGNPLLDDFAKKALEKNKKVSIPPKEVTALTTSSRAEVAGSTAGSASGSASGSSGNVIMNIYGQDEQHMRKVVAEVVYRELARTKIS